MKFKHRIWLLPIMTAVIVAVGISVSSRITAKTSAALERIEHVQYPTVEALRTMRSEVRAIEESLQRAVAEGDKQSLDTAESSATQVRQALKDFATADPDSKLDNELSIAFESYFSAALSATRIMLGTDKGDASAAIQSMQKTSAALTTLLTSSQESAIGEFRSLLTSGTQNIDRSLVVSLVMAGVMLFALGIGSWILIGSVFRSLGGEPEIAVATVRSIAAGDFTIAVPLRQGDEQSLLQGIETLRRKLGAVIRDVGQSSTTVDNTASEINTNIDNLSTRTSDQAASLQETASSMEEMTTSVRNSAENAKHATELANQARDRAERGGAVVTRAVAAMSEINASSRKIADIISVIDEIAFQTNLLALNAAVEAARAGEQGRGFAVVASEVRSLAQRSATAAREIKGLIEDSVGKVQDGSKLVDESGSHLHDIVAAATSVATIIAEISSASSQQAGGLDQVNKAIMHMDSTTQQNAAMSEEIAAAAALMRDQARNLTNMVAVFKVDGIGATTVPRQAAPATPIRAAASKPAVARPKLARPVVAAPRKVAGSDTQWQEF